MIWTRSEALVMSQNSCCFCFGLGLRAGRSGKSAVCNCVLRSIFRACYARFKQCAMKEKYLSRVSLEANPGRHRKSIWGLKNEEYMADFALIGKRAVSHDPIALGVFKYHFLLGAWWELCSRRLNLNRGEFFHEVYRVQQACGRAFRETEPYALFPLDEYFNSRATGKEQQQSTAAVVDLEAGAEKKSPPLRYPLKAAV